MTLTPAIIGAAIPVAASAARGAAKVIGGASAAFAEALNPGSPADSSGGGADLASLLGSIKAELEKLSGGGDFEIELDLSGNRPGLNISGPAADEVEAGLASAPELFERLVRVAQQTIDTYSESLGTNAITFFQDGWSLSSGAV